MAENIGALIVTRKPSESIIIETKEGKLEIEFVDKDYRNIRLYCRGDKQVFKISRKDLKKTSGAV